MRTDQLIVAILMVAVISWLLGEWRARSRAGNSGITCLHSRPIYYGTYTVFWTLIPALVVVAFWHFFENRVIESLVLSQLPEFYSGLDKARAGLLLNEITNIENGSLDPTDKAPEILQAAMYLRGLQSTAAWALTGLALSTSFAGLIYALIKIEPSFQARNKVEKAVNAILMLCACIAILTTIGIVLSVLFESLRFFSSVSVLDFIFGTHWSPQTAIRVDQTGSSGSFGAVPLFTGTLLISLIALLIAVPVGLMTAVYLGEYARARTRNLVKPVIEMLAGIPTVVYGFIAALSVAPVIRGLGENLGLTVASESALAAGLVMGVMIIPFVSSLSDDIMNSVPQSLRDGALALGATKSETVRQIVFPTALPGIMGAILLAASRAIGETMIVVMAAGLAAKLTANPLDAVTTITVQIVTLLTGDQEFDSPKTLAAFALGLMLFVTTLALNVYALHIVKKYSERYD